jgi:hypothetical protein
VKHLGDVKPVGQKPFVMSRYRGGQMSASIPFLATTDHRIATVGRRLPTVGQQSDDDVQADTAELFE